MTRSGYGPKKKKRTETDKAVGIEKGTALESTVRSTHILTSRSRNGGGRIRGQRSRFRPIWRPSRQTEVPAETRRELSK
jgi:hypothetical protein